MSIVQKLRTWLGLAPQPQTAPAGNDDLAAKKSAERAPGVIDLKAAYAAYRDGSRFVDVREPSEWAGGHIAGAVHHPVGALEQNPALAVARDSPVVTYCAAGARAARAASALAAAGYTDVAALQAGYDDWAAAGFPVERPQASAAS
jgi:rhodanese-related sulfurtransferase